MKRQHNKHQAGLRVILCYALGMLALSVAAPSLASYHAGTAGGTLFSVSAQQKDPDLCAIMEQAGTDEVENLSPGVGKSTFECYISYKSEDRKLETFSIRKWSSPGEAHGVIDDGKMSEDAPIQPTGAFGDPGYAYEVPEWLNQYGTVEEGPKLRYARNCYTVNASAGYYVTEEGRYKSRDPGPMRDLAKAVDRALQQAPCGAPASPTPTATIAAQSVDLTIDHMEVVQVVQTRDNKIPLVAAKKTVVRVFLKAETDSGDPGLFVTRASAYIWPEGKSEVELKAAPPIMVVSAGSTPDRNLTDSSLNFVIPPELTGPGVFSLKAVVNPDHGVPETDYGNNELTEPFEFEQRNGLRIGYVRVGLKVPGKEEYVWPTGPISTYDTFLKKVYPVAEVGFQYYELPWRVRVDGQLTYEKVSGELLRDLRALYDRIDTNRPDILAAWFPNSVNANNAGWNVDFGGVGFIGQPAALTSDWGAADDSSGVGLAHEVGHNLGLDHAVITGELPPNCSLAKKFSNDPGSAWPAEYGNSATIHEIGFDTQEMKAIPNSYYDFMSYCRPNRWISPFHYERLLAGSLRAPGRLIPPKGDRLSVSGTVLKGSIATFEIVGLPGNNSGGSGGGSVSSLPYPAGNYLMPGLAGSPLSLASLPRQVNQVREGTGGYCLRFMDASDTLLYERCFDPSPPHPSVTGVGSDEMSFALELPDPGDVARAVMVRTDGVNEDEVGSLTVSSNAPTLTVTSPRAGDRWEGVRTIEWTGSDADGEALRYDILYSADNKQSWYPLVVRSQATSYTFSTEEILPGDQTFIRVLASDGFNTSQAEVGPLVVPRQPNSPDPPPPPPSQADTGGTSASGPGSLPGGMNVWVLALVGAGVGFLLILGIFAIARRKPRPQPAQLAGQPPYAPPMPPAQPPGYYGTQPGPPQPPGYAPPGSMVCPYPDCVGPVAAGQFYCGTCGRSLDPATVASVKRAMGRDT